MNKTQFITDLKNLKPNDRFETIFLVRSKDIREKKNGVPFLSLTLADRTGAIDSKIWDNVTELAKTFEANDFIHARGKVQTFNNQHQAIVTWLRAVPEDQVHLGDYIPHTEFDIESMYHEVLGTIDSFSNPDLKRLLGSIFRDPEFARRYKRSPAARVNHHAKIGGLLEHVLSLLRLSKLMASHYDDLDSDLLACGVLLHDAGKIFELSSERSFEYTDNGKLLGHISMGSAWLDRRCDEIGGFPPRLKTLLLHLVLSHHGKLEFGSPQLPVFPEALALHFIDDLDAKLEMMRQARAGIVEGSAWSGFHHALGRSILDTAAYLGSDGSHEPDAVDPPQPPQEAAEESHSPAEELRTEDRRLPDAAPVAPLEELQEPVAVFEPPPTVETAESSSPEAAEAPEEETPVPPEVVSAESESVAETEPEPAEMVELEPAETAAPEPAEKTEDQRAKAAEQAQEKPPEKAPRQLPAIRPKPVPALHTVPPSNVAQPAPSPPLPMQPTLEGLESSLDDFSG